MFRTRRPNLMFVETPGEPAGSGQTDPRAAENADKTFTQAEVTAFLTREKDQGERAGKTAVATAINTKLAGAGLTDLDLDAVIALAAAAKTADDAKKTQAELDRDAALASKTTVEQELVTTREELRNVRITAALSAAGASTPDVAARALVVAADADKTAIAAAVEALKTEAPALFTGTPVAPAAPHTDGGTPPAGQKSTATPGAHGLSEAERRFGKAA